MDDLSFELKNMAREVRHGSQSTRANREKGLMQIAVDLKQMGCRGLQAKNLKPKHVCALVEHWKQQGISTGVMKNRMAWVRWWAHSIGKDNVVPSRNAFLGIENRCYVREQSRALELDSDTLQRVADPRIRLSLMFQAEFGLRREEALKIKPAVSDGVDRIRLKGSWCKGGRAREIPVVRASQAALLRDAKVVAGKGSMIPPQYSYREYVRIYERETAKIGLGQTHGLRHAYAIRRYEDLTGRRASVNGGLHRQQLSESDRKVDDIVRMQLARELGHGRIQIVSTYIGR